MWFLEKFALYIYRCVSFKLVVSSVLFSKVSLSYFYIWHDGWSTIDKIKYVFESVSDKVSNSVDCNVKFFLCEC